MHFLWKRACAPTRKSSRCRKKKQKSSASPDCCTISTTKNIPRRKNIRSVGNKIMRERGYPEDILRAILSHADYSGVKRESVMEKTLYACDELSGLITAATLVKPSKSISDLDAGSVRR